MDISVIIVNWNTKALLEQCLESLEQTAPASRSMEVIVVDNASIDGSQEMVESKFPSVKLIRSAENLGFAKGNNLGIQHSSGRYVSLVNSDVKVLPGCMDALAEFLDQNPKVGNAGPRVLNGDMTLQSSCRNFPGVWNNFCSATGLATAFKSSKLLSGEHMLFFAHDRIVTVDVLVGCFWMIRREALAQVGGLDESFFMYGEDVDWCRRCWNAGWEIAFVPTAQAVHYRGGSSGSRAVPLAVAQQNSTFHYWSKHKGAFGLMAIKGILLLHHAIRYLAGTLSRWYRSDENTKMNLKLRVTSACLRALLGIPESGSTLTVVKSTT